MRRGKKAKRKKRRTDGGCNGGNTAKSPGRALFCPRGRDGTSGAGKPAFMGTMYRAGGCSDCRGGMAAINPADTEVYAQDGRADKYGDRTAD